jgi:hypothetical protein
VGQRHNKSRGLIYFLEGKENYQLGTGIFVHHRIVSAVTRVNFFSISV